MIDLGIEFAIPPEVSGDNTGGETDNSRLFDMTPPMVPEIKRPKAP